MEKNCQADNKSAIWGQPHPTFPLTDVVPFPPDALQDHQNNPSIWTLTTANVKKGTNSSSNKITSHYKKNTIVLFLIHFFPLLFNTDVDLCHMAYMS